MDDSSELPPVAVAVERGAELKNFFLRISSDE